MTETNTPLYFLGKEPIPGAVMTRLAEDIGIEQAAYIQVHMYAGTSYDEYPECHSLSDSSTTKRQSQRSVCQSMFRTWCDSRKASCWNIDRQNCSRKQESKTNLDHRNGHATDRYCSEVMWAMRESSLVLGPAEDGGYWIIGGTGLPIEILTDIPWSTDKVWQSTVDKCTQLD